MNAQLGVVAAPGLLIYGEAGPAFVKLDQKLNFSGPVTSVSQTATAANFGVGFAFQPPGWQVAGHPLAIFTQLNRIILPTVTFDNSGSPGFFYRNENAITQVKFGVRMQFDDFTVAGTQDSSGNPSLNTHGARFTAPGGDL